MPVSDVIRLVEISDAALDVTRLYNLVTTPAAGGVALFVGTVRDHDGGKQVHGLDYSAHPSAEAELRKVLDEGVDKHDVVAVAAAHRVGELAIGDVAVVVAVACGHRGDAFVACRWLIDEIKGRVPIWKHQTFADGTEEWVGTP